MLRLILSFDRINRFGRYFALAQSYDDAKKCAAAVQRNDSGSRHRSLHGGYSIRRCLGPRSADRLQQTAGLAYYHKKNYDRAIEDYDQLIRLIRTIRILSIAVGSHTLRRMTTDRADPGLRMKLSNSIPTVPRALQKRGWAYESKNDL